MLLTGLTERIKPFSLNSFSQPPSQIDMCRVISVSFKTLDKSVKCITILSRGCEEDALDFVFFLMLGVVDVINVAVRKEMVPLQVREEINRTNILHQGDKINFIQVQKLDYRGKY